MIPPGGDMKNLGDLKGRKIGVAGGPLDKGCLLLQGMAHQEHAMDLSAENDIMFGAPPLLAEKA
jgi:NitT/TauT family transport system substrate-binding protein